MTSRSPCFPIKKAVSLLLSGVVCLSFLAQPAAPAFAQDNTPTPEPASDPTEEVTTAPVFEPQPAAGPRFRAYQDIVLDYIHMVSQTEGWSLSGQTVLTTVNAGLTWHEASPPETIPDGSAAVPYATFLDKNTAWVIYAIDGKIDPAASVWSTVNGGLTWTQSIPLNHQAYGDKLWAEFNALDANTLWMMVRGMYVGAGTHYNHNLFRSLDGGLTWEFLPSEFSDDYTGLDFADVLFGVRTLQTARMYAPSPPAYEITEDGGATWQLFELPPPPLDPNLFDHYPNCETYQPVALTNESYRMIVACFDNFDPPQRYEGYFYSSRNGGKTWLFGKLPQQSRPDTAQLAYFDTENVFLLGKHSFQSSDNGMKWSYLKVVNWDGQFSFPDPQHGFAIARLMGGVSLVKTTDRAATWKIVLPRVVR